MTIRRPFVLLLLAALLIASSLVPAAGAVSTQEKVIIVCANSTLADFTSNIMGELAQVEYIMPAGVCPSHYDGRPSDLEMVARADIIVQLGWEGWLNGMVSSSGNSDVALVKCMGLGEWNLPEGAKAHVDLIAEGLAELLPDLADTIGLNAEAYKASIDAKAEELRNWVVAEGIAGKRAVVMEWQREFVEWLGFEVVAAYPPPEGLSVKEQLNVTKAASRDDVVMVVDNIQSGTEFGANVASQTGAIHVILTNFPEAYPGTDSYLEMIDYNTGKLIDGAKTYEYKKGEIANLESQVADLELQASIYLSLTLVFLVVSLFMGALFWRSRSRGE